MGKIEVQHIPSTYRISVVRVVKPRIDMRWIHNGLREVAYIRSIMHADDEANYIEPSEWE